MPSKPNLATKVNSNRVAIALILFLLSLVVFNVAFEKTGGWARVFWSSAGYITLFAVYKFAGLNVNEVGLSAKKILPGLKLGGYIVALTAVVFLLAFLVDRHIYNDSRYHHSFGTAFYSAAVLLPLKTVFFEEIAFRGILLGLLIKIKNDKKFAIIWSSVAFGLWHVLSSTGLNSGSVSSHSMTSKIFTAIGVVMVTGVAGALFSLLRLRSKSLAAPIVVHWFINGFAIVLASLSWS